MPRARDRVARARGLAALARVSAVLAAGLGVATGCEQANTGKPRLLRPVPIQAPLATGVQVKDGLGAEIKGNAGAYETSVGMTVVPVRPTERAIRAGIMSVRGADTDIPSPLWYLGPEPETPPSAGGSAQRASRTLEDHVRDWLGPMPVWRATKGGPRSKDVADGGFWVVVVTPPDGFAGDRVTVDGREVVLSWRDAGALLPARPSASSTLARTMLEQYRRDPAQRWRARLAAGEAIVLEAGAQDLFADAIVEGLARTYERTWATALNNLDAADPNLGSRVRARLASVVEVGEGLSMPIWTSDPTALEALQREMLDGSVARRKRFAQDWLDQQPIGGAVVMDDAAAIDAAAGLTFPRILLANLSDSSVAAWASRAENTQTDMLRIEPMTAVGASVGASLKADEKLPAGRRMGLEAARPANERRTLAEVHVGEWSARRAVVGEFIAARPPGPLIGPLMSDWTQRTFLAAAVDLTPGASMPTSAADRVFAGRLYRKVDEPEAASDAGDPEWMLYFEFASAGDEDRSEIIAYFGPRGGGAATALRILADGTVFDVRSGVALPSSKARVARSGDRTSLWVPVPVSAIEGGRVLRLGLVRVDGSGRRAAWPRPMLPWQTEPGRIALDLSAWSPVKE